MLSGVYLGKKEKATSKLIVRRRLFQRSRLPDFVVVVVLVSLLA